MTTFYYTNIGQIQYKLYLFLIINVGKWVSANTITKRTWACLHWPFYICKCTTFM